MRSVAARWTPLIRPNTRSARDATFAALTMATRAIEAMRCQLVSRAWRVGTAIDRGTSRATSRTGNSHTGPNVNRSGSVTYSRIAATTAADAGQRDSGRLVTPHAQVSLSSSMVAMQ